MAFQTKDGKKKFGSAFVAKRYDSMHNTPTKGDEAEAGEGKSNLGGDLKAKHSQRMNETESTVHPVVTEHGSANTVTIHHDHKNNKHSVVSHHEDGHVHMADHEDAKTAHEEGGQLANVSLKDSGEQEDQQLAQSEGGNSSAPDGYQMPDLA